MADQGMVIRLEFLPGLFYTDVAFSVNGGY